MCRATLAFLLLGVVAACERNAEVEIASAWVRAGPPTSTVFAGYFVATNRTNRDRSLVGASSPSFERVMIHQTEMHDGVSRMVAQPSVDIGAGERIEFAPGGWHLMLMEPTGAAPAPGATVTIRIELDDGQVIEQPFEVRDAR